MPVIKPIVKVPTLSELAYQSIKEQILSGQIRPGEKVNVDQYSAGSGISTTPIREALSKLQQEGLVKHEPRIGWHVSKISKEEFRKLQELKALLEITLADRALPFIKPKDIPRIEQLNDEMQELMFAMKDKPNLEKLLEANDKFHRAIFDFYPNDIMIDTLQQTWNNLKYARLLWISSAEFQGSFYEEHKEIIDAIKKNDRKELHNAVSKHLHLGLDYMEACLEGQDPNLLFD